MCYNNFSAELPIELLQIKNFVNLMDYQKYKATFSEEEQQHLSKFLPASLHEFEREEAL